MGETLQVNDWGKPDGDQCWIAGFGWAGRVYKIILYLFIYIYIYIELDL